MISLTTTWYKKQCIYCNKCNLLYDMSGYYLSIAVCIVLSFVPRHFPSRNGANCYSWDIPLKWRVSLRDYYTNVRLKSQEKSVRIALQTLMTYSLQLHKHLLYKYYMTDSNLKANVYVQIEQYYLEFCCYHDYPPTLFSLHPATSQHLPLQLNCYFAPPKRNNI